MKIWQALKAYLTDLKNLAFHAVVGLLILALALFLPVPLWLRLLFLLLAVSFNLLRMRLAKKTAAASLDEGMVL